MPARKRHEGADKVYDAAQKWVDCALRSDDSLFTPGKEIWSERWLGELRSRFLDRPDVGGRTFYDKLRDQLKESPPEVYQLMGEVLYFRFLIIWPTGMRADTRAERIARILNWSQCPEEVPPELAECFKYGITAQGSGMMLLPYLVGFIIEFAERWRGLDEAERERLLDDPWAFKEMVWSFQLTSVLLRYTQNAPHLQRRALMHLVFPDMFEGIVAGDDKEKIVNAEAFWQYVEDPDDDVDRKLQQIRQGLEAKIGRDFDFYDLDIQCRWKS